MNTLQLLNCINQYNNLHDICLGVFSSDNLPYINNYPCCFIANTHPSNKPGEHWVAFYIDSNFVELFDSYGQKPYKVFSQYMKSFDNIIYNKYRLQGVFSTTCGHYSIFYLLLRSLGIYMGDYINMFGDSLHDNDHKIVEIVEYIFNIPQNIYAYENKFLSQICTYLGH